MNLNMYPGGKNIVQRDLTKEGLLTLCGYCGHIFHEEIIFIDGEAASFCPICNHEIGEIFITKGLI